MGKKILVIDDDPELGRIVEAVLRHLDIVIYQAYSGSEGLKKAYEIHPDLVILDIMMPGMDGFDVCARLRDIASVPVLMLTARANETDMLRGFNAGVDDFIRKPFHNHELEARVRALLRRSSKLKVDDKNYITSYKDDYLEIDLSSQTVRLSGEIVHLTPREFGLLACLVREQGRILSHQELEQEIWGGAFAAGASPISSLYVHYLRKKLQDGKYGHQYVHTLWGRGYWFEPRKDNQTT